MNAFRGAQFSQLVLGTRRFAESGLRGGELVAFLEGAIESGLSTVDTADVYGDHGTEGLLGEAFRSSTSLRARLQIVTKCGLRPRLGEGSTRHYDASRAHLVAQVENSLRALNTDHLDALLIHRPDPLMDADELAEVFCALKQSGKVRGFGVAHFRTCELELLQSRLPFPLLVNQIPFSLSNLSPISDGVLTQCQKMRISPMATGVLDDHSALSEHLAPSLAGDRMPYVTSVLSELAERTNVTADQLALAWVMRHPAQPIPVIETVKLERIRLAAAAAQLKLERSDWYRLLEAAAGREVS
ncbi:aldo/keto reductase [Niveibacterium sp. 24ML]|uniref:aldo/keto reductase n=1 Tax=Niveibacterium sp. 24ML TaxID=2985512 RepID=UPI002270CA21|nr:aldo/keto reductase [Niveibacterium sp. 24ML]MCX9157062.1 aldo/keto reductase [Niveibacterium sp. 24ML]